MTRKNVKAKTKQNPVTSADAVKTFDNSADERIPLDSVEKMLLGAVPDDPVEPISDTASIIPDARTSRLEIARSFLARQPKFRAELAQEVEEAWRSAGGKRGEFLTIVAERRAQIQTMAQLDQLQRQAPSAVAEFNSELSRYLIGIEGLSTKV